jgi:hypothetical protein
MRIKPIVAALSTALLALAAAAPASAKTEDLGPLTDRSAYFGNVFLTPVSSFTDYYTFSLSHARDVVGGTLTLDFGPWFDVNIFSVALSGSGISGWLTDNVASNGFSFANISSGNYTLAVNGNVTGIWGGAYGGVIAGAVPEPETYAMMLLGLGAVGWAARRRKQQQQPKR